MLLVVGDEDLTCADLFDCSFKLLQIEILLLIFGFIVVGVVVVIIFLWLIFIILSLTHSYLIIIGVKHLLTRNLVNFLHELFFILLIIHDVLFVFLNFELRIVPHHIILIIEYI